MQAERVGEHHEHHPAQPCHAACLAALLSPGELHPRLGQARRWLSPPCGHSRALPPCVALCFPSCFPHWQESPGVDLLGAFSSK